MSSTDTAEPTHSAVSNALAPSSKARRRRGGGLSIQSKLLVMLLSVSLVSSVIVGVIGYVSGRESLREAALDQLTTIRELRVGEIEDAMANLQRGVKLDSTNASAVEGVTAYVDGFAQLQNSNVTPEQAQALEDYYASSFVPELESRSGLDFDPAAFVPATPAGRYLQTYYTANHAYDDYDFGLTQPDPGDGSAWSAADAQYGDYFEGLVQTLGYEDLLVVDTDGNVVYSAYKSVDLGVNLSEEPYASSSLTEAIDEALRTGAVDRVVTTDFERYLPSLNVPTAWVVSPVGSATDIRGVMAIQVPIDLINSVMTGDEGWERDGLGQTGEVYLAGPDKTMRSVSRELVEHLDRYADAVIANGTPPELAERIVAVGGTVLLQPVNTASVDSALAGERGTSISQSYIGTENLTAYAPVRIDGLNWVAVARIDTAEAFAPVTDFTRTLLLSLLGIMIAVSVLSLLLAQVFTRPIRKLVEAVRRVAGGDLAVQVPQGSRDEFGDLGSAFNDMASSLRIKQDLIDEQQVENQKLMHTLMPEAVARRYKEGEETISEEHDNVSVVFAELVGFDDFAADLTGDRETSLLNSLMRGFDEAANKAGVEKVRTLRGGYLASSGLIVPRVDNVRRAVDFAREMRTVVQRFNSQNGTAIDLRAGVDTGSVTSGLVARTSLAYDLWGDAVSLAYRVRSVTGLPGIYVTQAVRDRMQDSVVFAAAGEVELRGKTQNVWRVE